MVTLPRPRRESGVHRVGPRFRCPVCSRVSMTNSGGDITVFGYGYLINASSLP
jgi:cytochrome c-type biogenesis protein CcmH/NrfF